MLRMGYGIVEKIDGDPHKTGRINVRMVHFDGTSSEIPTDKLPLASVLQPSTGVGAQGVAGAGMSPVGIRNGATVAVLYDSDNPEFRVVIGTQPVAASSAQGRSAAGSLAGTNSSTPGTYGLSGAPFQAKTNAAKTVHPDQPQYTRIAGDYTNTFSTKSDSGMFFHLHDKKGQTFYSQVHPSGTFTEMQSDGSIAEGVMANKKTSIDGQYTVGSEGNFAMFTNSDMEIKVKGNLKITAANIEMKASGITTIIGKSKVDINP